MSADLSPRASERVPTDPRLSRRRRAVTRLRRRRIAARAAAACAVSAGVWLALWSPLLRVRVIEIVGARHTTAADVARAAGLDPADNLLLLSTGDVATMTEDLPWVRTAKVERRLPGTVKVSVTERRPAMILATEAGPWTLDARGRVLTAGRVGGALTELRASPGAAPTPGEVVADQAARKALRAYGSLRHGTRRRVEVVLGPTPERIGFQLETGTLVRWGSVERLRAKRAVLGALLLRLRREGRTAAYIDVSVPETPALSSAPLGAPPPKAPSPDASDGPERKTERNAAR
jgi:cell division protein FtsQ